MPGVTPGARFGGHALYVKDNRLHYVYSFVGMFEQMVVATEDVPTGENVILSASPLPVHRRDDQAGRGRRQRHTLR